MNVARDLGTDEIGLFEGFVLTAKFHLGHHQTGVGAMKLVDLERVGTALHQPAVLVDHASSA